jgi:hypothetical protein
MSQGVRSGHLNAFRRGCPRGVYAEDKREERGAQPLVKGEHAKTTIRDRMGTATTRRQAVAGQRA